MLGALPLYLVICGTTILDSLYRLSKRNNEVRVLAHAFRKLDMLGCSQASLVHIEHTGGTLDCTSGAIIFIYIYIYICFNLTIDKDLHRNPFNSWLFFFLKAFGGKPLPFHPSTNQPLVHSKGHRSQS